MSTEATQGTGADVVDLESMFEAMPDVGNENQTQVQTGNGKQTQQVNADQNVEVVGEDGEPIIEIGDNGEEVIVDPNGENDPNEPTELVIPDDHQITLTIDGKEETMTYGDLKTNVQMRKASEARFAEAAAIRKEYTDKAAGLGQRENQLGQVLQFYIQQSQEFLAKEPNWTELLQAGDMQRYAVEKHNWDLRTARLREAQQVQQNLQRHQAEQQAASNQTRVAEAQQELLKAIPEWADPTKRVEGAKAIDQYLEKSGIPAEMRSAIDSAAVLVIARKAMLYDNAVAAAKARKSGAAGQAGQTGAANPARQTRQTRQVERPGAGTAAQTAASRNNLNRANASKAFNANPSVDTLASMFE